MNINRNIAVIGAGIAGMETAKILAQQGYAVSLLEKEKQPGGHLNNWHRLFPDFTDAAHIRNNLETEIEHDNIKKIYNTEITGITKEDKGFIVSSKDELMLKADAVVLASGFKTFDARRKEEYGYGIFRNVVTSVEVEKMLQNDGTLKTPNGTVPKRIAIIHCVGSRDAKAGNTYCSKVCCITGVKQAIEINKQVPECEIFCFYMDLRLYALQFDSLFLQAQKLHKIQFIRGRLSEAAERRDKSIQIKAEDTLSGRPLRMDVDMVVLLVGIEPGEQTAAICNNTCIEQNDDGFFKSEGLHTDRNLSTHPGIFLAGTCAGPMPVNETIENARSAACSVMQYCESKK